MGAARNRWHSACVNDYERVAQVIKYLDEHHFDQPDLAALAQQAGLSPFHFHRMFAKWAGVTPKDFLQCLTLSHAKDLLRQGESVLKAALETGLSGPGRLHDLCINLEAASPGELKSGGAGMEIRYGFASTPFGEWLAAENDRGVCHISFGDAEGRENALATLKNAWPKARLARNNATAAHLSAVVFSGSRGTRQTLNAFVNGTPFQVRVWRALLQIPAGALASYGSVADAIGNPTAARAVGSAVGQNAVAFLIPCHRVIRETGVIGNYRWGETRKRSMLIWEAAAAAPMVAQVSS